MFMLGFYDESGSGDYRFQIVSLPQVFSVKDSPGSGEFQFPSFDGIETSDFSNLETQGRLGNIFSHEIMVYSRHGMFFMKFEVASLI